MNTMTQESNQESHKAANNADWLESHVRRAFATAADGMFGKGELTRSERTALDEAIKEALNIFRSHFQEGDLAALRTRRPGTETTVTVSEEEPESSQLTPPYAIITETVFAKAKTAREPEPGPETEPAAKAEGLYLVEPHGRLIADRKKTLIAKSKHLPLEGTWLLISKENNIGLEYGKITVGEPRAVAIDKFDSLFKYHRVTPKERSRWWPTKIELYLYPITSLEPHGKPKPVEIPAGTQTIMEKIKYLSTPDESKPEPDHKPDLEPGQDRERPYTEVGSPRTSDTHSDPAEKELERKQEEVIMPYTSMENVNPAIRGIKPPVTLAQANIIAGWADKIESAADDGARSPWAVAIAQFKKLYQVQAGKWVKKKSEKGFISLHDLLGEFGLDEIMVKARGEGQGVGGPPQGDQGAELCACPKCGHEIKHKRGVLCAEIECPECGTPMKGKSAKEPKDTKDTEPETELEFKSVWTTAQVNDFPDSSFLFVESGEKDSEGKTTPRSLRHLPYKDKGGQVDPAHVRNAISRAPRIKLKDGSGISPDKATALQNKARAILAKTKPSKKEITPSDDNSEADKGGRRLQSEKLGLLSSLKEKFESLLKDLGELIGWAAYDDRKPIMFQESSGFKALKAQDGQTHLLTWTMNAFKDREGEIFTLKSIEDYVARNAGQATKGTFDFWHLPGTDFGKITWQGIVGRFLVESGPFDDTPIGHQAEKFFLAHAKGHSGIAPEGWGTSHAYVYKETDKQNGVYTWFDKRKTTVLPRSAAANIFNPELEVTIMDQKQKDALVEIWGEDTASQIIKLGESKTKEHEQAGVATKSQENADSGESQEGESQEAKGAGAVTETTGAVTKPEQEVKEIVTEIAGELQLGALSDAFKALGDAVSKIGEEVQGINTRLDALEVTDEKKLAEKELALPRYSWFVASQAAETVLGKDDALKSARPQVPETITRLSGLE